MKILFQQLWEMKVEWDQEVPLSVRETWLKWRSELDLLSTKHIPRLYNDKNVSIVTTELHGFSDASLRSRSLSSHGMHQWKHSDYTRYLQNQSRPHQEACLELCGAQLLAQLLHHVRLVLRIPLDGCYAWTDITIVLHWLRGNPRSLKTYVGNRISNILELFGPECWRHVRGVVNPADCASRGLFPSEPIKHELWWEGPEWLKHAPSQWPDQSQIPLPKSTPEEE